MIVWESSGLLPVTEYKTDFQLQADHQEDNHIKITFIFFQL